MKKQILFCVAAALALSACNKVSDKEFAQAIQSCDAVKIEEMLNKGANPNVHIYSGGATIGKGDDLGPGLSFVLWPCKKTELTDLFITKGVDVNGKSAEGFTVLMSAVGANDVNTIKKLLAAGADVNARAFEGTGSSPLFDAIMLSREENTEAVVKLLIASGAQLNVQVGETGATPLILASMMNKKNIVQILLDAGADTSIKTEKGKTALDYANEKGYKDIAALLQKNAKKKTSAK
ncbi:ankyrin repeat protein [Elusimicrobium posterum]|uniref:ankyrin repeat domain-containing protein n=1 Tax=Elusimicrobium posterum TaxID=3116653 RepID=UPI003C737810